MQQSIIELSEINDKNIEKKIDQIIDKYSLNKAYIWNLSQSKNVQKFQDFVELIKNSKKISLQQLHIGKNVRNQVSQRAPQIIRPNIYFNALKMLTLPNCKIVNIEFIVNLKAQSLKYLHLNNNHITRAKSLRKCYFPGLQQLRIEGNELIEADFLNEMFNTAKQFTLQIQDFENQQIIQNIKFLFKTPYKLNKVCNEQNILDLQSQNRIKQQQLLKYTVNIKSNSELGPKIYTFKKYYCM